ncbi:hypothetical protein HDU81_001999 [Chytriomyces hyalinus]|nr:hypothetical protein HDU81_001999 [Chytriomyces hyalinus]
MEKEKKRRNANEGEKGVYISRRKLKRQQRQGEVNVPADQPAVEDSVIRAERQLIVGIVGGGLGGLALAAGLQRVGVSCVVLERDSHVDARAQGYGLTLQQAGRALRRLGLEQAVLRGGVASASHFICDHEGKLALFWGTTSAEAASTWDPSRNCHIARQVLRKELLAALDSNYVSTVWGFHLDSVEEVDCKVNVKGRHIPGDTDGQIQEKSYEFDVLVACDGIRSSIRSIVLEDKPSNGLKYLDSFVMLGIFENAQFPVLHERMIQMSNGFARIFLMPFDETRSMWQLSFPMLDEAGALVLSRGGSSGLKVEALKQCSGFADPILPIIESTDESFITGYPVYDRDPLTRPIHYKNSFKRVTLVGDAAHPMSPFKGQGANQALIDAVDLAEALSSVPLTDIPHALRQYEAKMIPRTTPKVLGSRHSVQALHSPQFHDIRYQLERRQYERIDDFASLMENLRSEGVGIWSSNDVLNEACDRQNAMMRAHKQ